MGLLATVVAAYWAADQVHLLWVFWLLVPVAVLYGLLRAFGRSAFRAIGVAARRVQDYERLAQAAGHAIADRDDLRNRLAEMDTATLGLLPEAIRIGRARVVAEALGAASNAALSPVACLIEDGEFYLVCRIESGDFPEIGSRLFLRVVGANRAKAALTVDAVAVERGNVNLVVDEVMDQLFMEGLRERAHRGSDPPGGVIVAPRVFDDLTDLRREVNDAGD